MGWNIHVESNTTKASRTSGTPLGGRLIFNPDHGEHQDYLKHAECIGVLRDHKARGEVCFASLEGDNAGEAWDYRFDGKGGAVALAGHRVWKMTRVLR